jgi:hypothetical protein
MDGRFYIRQMEWMEMDAQTSISIHSIHLKKCVEWIATLFVAVSSLLAAVSGYDGSLMGSINSYEQYRSYFGF